MSDDSLMVEGRKYLSSKRSAELLGYSSDYIGELCRKGKVDSLKRGRQWYVEEQSLFRHLEASREQIAARKHELSLHLSRQLGKPLVSSVPRETRRIAWSLPARIGKFFSSRKLLRAGIGSLLIVAIFFAQTPVARAGLEEFSLASILRITRSVTDDLTVSFTATVQKTATSLSAAAVLSRDRVLDTLDAVKTKTGEVAASFNQASVSVSSAVEGVKSAITASVQGATGAAKAATEGVASSFHKASVSVASALGGAKSAVTSSVQGVADSLSAAVFSTQGALRTNLLAAIQYEDTFNLFRTGVQNVIDATLEKVTDVLGGSTTPASGTSSIGSESGSGGGSTSVTPSAPSQPELQPKTLPERIIERIVRVETPVIQNITQEAPSTRVVGGVSAAALDLRLQQVSNELRAEISRVSGSSAAQVSNVFQVIGQATRIDSLSNTVITSPSITGGTIKDTSLTGSTNINSASISALTLSTATTSAENGFNISAGCFAVNGVCVGSGGSGDVGSGIVGQFAFYNAAGTTLTATSSIFLTAGGNIGIGTTSPTARLGVQGSLEVTGTTTTGALTATGTVTFLTALGATSGGTGQTTFTTGDILYASGANTLSKLAVGSNGQVLKLSGGVPSWAADLQGSGGGGGGLFATTTNDMVIYPVDTTDVFVLGNNATTTTGTILEVTGNTRLIGELRVTGSTTLQNLMVTNVTSTNATTTSSFATTASSTNLFTSNFTLGRVSGFLKATVGAVATSLIDLAADVTGILPVANGGTGWSNLQANTLLLGNGSGAIATTTAGTNGQVLALVGGVPTWQSTTTLANISGTLAVSSGGTGATTFGAGGFLVGNGTGAITSSSSPTVGYVVATSTTGTSTFAGAVGIGVTTLSEGAKLQTNGIIYSNNAGGISYALNSSGSNYGLIQNDAANTWSLAYKSTLSSLGTSVLTWNSSGLVGIGSTTPFAKLSVDAPAGTAAFSVGSSTATALLVDSNGRTVVRPNGSTGSLTDFASLFVGVRPEGTNATIALQAGASKINLDAYSSSGNNFGIYDQIANAYRFLINGSGLVGIGSTTPFAKLAINPVAGDTNQFVVGSSTATSFVIDNAGRVGVAMTTPAYDFQVGGLGSSNRTIYAGSNSNDYLSLATDGSGHTVTLTAGNAASASNALVFSTANSGSVAERARITGAGFFGIGSTTPWARFAVNPVAGDTNQFVVGSSTATSLLVNNAGYVGIGTTNPTNPLTILPSSTDSGFILQTSDNSNIGAKLFSNTTRGKFDLYNSGTVTMSLNGNPTASSYLNLSTGGFGLGTTSPYAKLAVHANNGETGRLLFDVASSTASATTSLFNIANTGTASFAFPGNSSTLVLSGSNSGQVLFSGPSYIRFSSNLVPNTTNGYSLGETGTAWQRAYVYSGASIGSIFSGITPPTSGLIVQGNTGVGSSSPIAKLSVHGLNGDTNTLLFDVASSTASATSSLFNISNTGVITSNASATSTFAAGLQATALNVTGATSTFANGIQLTSGCFRMADGTCAGAGSSGGGSGTVNSGTQGQLPYYAANGTALTGTSQLFLSSANLFGIGSTSPWAKLAVNPVAGDTNQFVVGSSTATSFLIDEVGKIAIGLTSTFGKLTINSTGAPSVSGNMSNGLVVANGTGGTAINVGTHDTGSAATAYSFIKGAYINSSQTAVALALQPTKGNVGVGSTTPFAKLSVHANDTETNVRLFEIASSTASATTSLFTVLNNGRVGIGTTSPIELLSINGASPQISFQDTGTGRGAYFGLGDTFNAIINAVGGGDVVFKTGGTERGRFAGTGLFGIASTSPFAKLAVNPVAGDTNQFVVGSSTATAFLIDPSGKVGIGTTAPGEKLDIAGSGATRLRVSDTSSTGVARLVAFGANGYIGNTSGTGSLIFQTNSTDQALITSGGLFSIGSTTPWAKLAVNPVAGDTNQFVVGSSTATSFLINNAGNVGIGTTSPLAKLSVQGSAAGSVLLGEWGGSSAYGAISFNSSLASGFANLYGSPSDTTLYIDRPTGGQLNFRMNGTDQMSLRSTGFLGIGTTSPWAKLAVNPVAGDTNQFVVGSSTVTSLLINNAGLVGIGRTDPSYKLDVSGGGLRVTNTGTVLVGADSGRDISLQGGSADTVSYIDFSDLGSEDYDFRLTTAPSANRFTLSASTTGSIINLLGTGQIGFNDTSPDFKFETVGSAGSGYFGITNSTDGDVLTVTSSGFMGIGSTTPWAKLAVNPVAGDTNQFVIGSSTATSFIVNNAGWAGIKTDNPQGILDLNTGSGGANMVFSRAGTIKAYLGTAVSFGTAITDDLNIRSEGSNILFGFSGAEKARFTSGGNLGIGSTTPLAKLSIHANNGETTTRLFDVASSTQTATSSLFTVFNNGNIGVGTTSPFARFAINPVAGDRNQFAIGSSTVTSFIIDPSGKVGIGKTAPATKLDVFEANSVAQLRLSKSASLYSELTVDSTGDLTVSAAGGDIYSTTENLWICDGGSCPALTATSTAGNIFVENAVTFGNGFSFRQISVNELGLYNASSSLLMIFDQGN